MNFSGILEVNQSLCQVNDINDCDYINSIYKLVQSRDFKTFKIKSVDFGTRKVFDIDEVVKKTTLQRN